MPERNVYEKACKEEYEKMIQVCNKAEPIVLDLCAERKKRLVVLAEKLQSASGTSAEKLLTEIQEMKQQLATCEVTLPADPCVEVKKTIVKLEDALKRASQEEAKKIKESLEDYNKKYITACATRSNHRGVKNPCDEAAMLKDSLDNLYKK